MTAFEFFFGFYGLILGLAVVEVVGGFSRTLKARRLSALGLCTPLLALFVLLDLIQFWADTWGRTQEPAINSGVLTVALAIAATYYLAASLIFPDEVEACPSFDDHFDAQKRRVVMASIMANALGYLVLPVLAGQAEGFADSFSLPGLFWLAVWVTPLLLICLVRSRRINAALLAWQCLVYIGLTFWEAVAALQR